MRFSIIVPFLNEEKYIGRCIDSLLAQDFDRNEYELIFVDNGSTDKSGAIVKQYEGITLLYEVKKSSFAARNKALEVAKGQIIAFTDADCSVCPDWLSQIYQGMNTANATIAMGRVFFGRRPSVYLEIIQDYWNAKIEYLLANRYTRYYYGYTNNMAVRSLVFKELGGFRERSRSGDTEMVHRCLAHYPDCKIIYLDKMEVRHLEVKRLITWLRKVFIYGINSVLIERTIGYTPLKYQLQRRIYSSCVKKNHQHSVRRILSLFLLGIGNLSYKFGRITGKIRRSFFKLT